MLAQEEEDGTLRHPREAFSYFRPGTIPKGAASACHHTKVMEATVFMPVIGRVWVRFADMHAALSLFTHLHEHLLSTRPPGHLVSMNSVVKNADI